MLRLAGAFIRTGRMKDLLNLLSRFESQNFLKNQDVLVGNILFEQRLQFFSYDKKIRDKIVKKIYSLSESGREKVEAYVAAFYSGAAPAKQMDIILNYSDYVLLTKRRALTNDVIENIKSSIEAHTSTPWRHVLSDYLRWPTTDAPESLKKILSPFIDDVGVLSVCGYSVGKNGKTKNERINVLEEILKGDLRGLDLSVSYLLSWGDPNSISRLMKLAKTIAALCRNAKRSKADYLEAIENWTEDLAYLKENYYEKVKESALETWPEL
jgi:hypothetical protein